MRFKNVLNSLPTAASGVTNTINFVSAYRLPPYIAHRTPALLYRRFISFRNDFNGITTTIVLPGSTYASNINNTLLPTPVGITTTTGLYPILIASNTGFYTLRKTAFLPTNYRNYSSPFILFNRI
ncbi:hypothetical protein B0J12DRAFT_579784 [Macrophomina phaseolina]|uniref:Uncharacterized protein n=1 Tax=Macrophomina phaseolina TaxID=35725 RepID=A0ABQ8G1A2_9PEZI|nr:hypothetical protein B0J12DRAFT_579784 [Macrophomina phaseolina]